MNIAKVNTTPIIKTCQVSVIEEEGYFVGFFGVKNYPTLQYIVKLA